MVHPKKPPLVAFAGVEVVVGGVVVW